jgi:cellulose biosynthesis protein BcsQ
MGKILAVWSDSKQSGKSVVTYMLANQMSGNKKLKVLVCCLNLKHSSLYRLFGIDSSDTGLEDLINYKFFENMKEEIIQGIIPRYGDICFLGSYKMTNSYAVKNAEKFADLFEMLKNLFDLIIVDTVSESGNILSKLVLHQADMILKLYCQDIECINGLKPSEKKVSANKETVHLISKYRNIYPKVSDLKRRFGINKVFTHEYCETLQEMKNRNSLHLYLQRETACNKSVEKISGYMLQELGIAAENGVTGDGKAGNITPSDGLTNGRGIFGRFLRRFGIGGAKSLYTKQKWSLK